MARVSWAVRRRRVMERRVAGCMVGGVVVVSWDMCGKIGRFVVVETERRG